MKLESMNVEKKPKIMIIPMIDIMFFLLVFFMISTLYMVNLKTVDVNIRRLRLKIEDNATNPTYITTIWGFGYKWGL